MNVGTNGIVVDQHGNVLLIKRNDTRTFAPPGGALDAGELPPDGTAREVREETGLIVLPVRLAALTYLPLGPSGFLGFTFRCLLRGGEITTSEESPVVGFFKTNPLPGRISSFHRERVEKAMAHAEERPLFFQHSVSTFSKAGRFVLQNVIYRWMDVKRKLQGLPPYQPPPTWDVGVYLLICNDAGDYLWQQPDENALWQLPGGIATNFSQAPWETAVQQAQQQTGHQLKLNQLCDVYLGSNGTQLSLIFSAESTVPPPNPPANLCWFPSGNEPTNSQPQHRVIAANGRAANQPTQFHSLPSE